MGAQKTAVLIGAGAVTDTELIAAPGAGFRIVVNQYTISVGGIAANVELQSGTDADNRTQFRFGINGGTNSGLIVWELGDNENLNITTSANGPTDTTIIFNIGAV